MTAQKNEGNNWKEKAFATPKTARASKILAKSFYNQLKSNGFTKNDILEVSNEIIGLLTSELKNQQ